VIQYVSFIRYALLPDCPADALVARAFETVNSLQEWISRRGRRQGLEVIDEELITVVYFSQCCNENGVIYETNLCVGRAAMIEK